METESGLGSANIVHQASQYIRTSMDRKCTKCLVEIFVLIAVDELDKVQYSEVVSYHCIHSLIPYCHKTDDELFVSRF